ncbi:MAG: CDP-alcohol phosphatidyltransferase family protein [Candidatus Zixiibacteriota bacterium]
MVRKELLQPANLLSLSRIAVTPLMLYLLAIDNTESTIWCLALLVLAGITDGLDGIVARRMNQVGRLGMVLDPLADKVLAGALVIGLWLYREFPLWLVASILGRDLIILIAAALLLRGQQMVEPSNITGKYTFFAIIVLLSSAIVRFDFGVTLFSAIVPALLILSLVLYARQFLRLGRGLSLPTHNDSPGFKIARLIATALVSLVVAWKLLQFLGCV